MSTHSETLLFAGRATSDSPDVGRLYRDVVFYAQPGGRRRALQRHRGRQGEVRQGAGGSLWQVHAGAAEAHCRRSAALGRPALPVAQAVRSGARRLQNEAPELLEDDGAELSGGGPTTADRRTWER